MTAIVKLEQPSLMDVCDNVERTKELAKKLMMTKHYQKIGEDGIFAICMVAQANQINQLDALNGELYYVQGRVGMSAEAMNKYIRKAGHSITLKKLDDNGCTVIGKRKDNGDTAEITYGIDDMRSAGKNYEKNKKDMFFARAVSRLKRVLFPDLLCKIYEKSEIEEIARDEKETQELSWEKLEKSEVKPVLHSVEEKPKLPTTQVIELLVLYRKCSPEYQATLFDFMEKKYKTTDFENLPFDVYESFKKPLVMKSEEYQKKLADDELASLQTKQE